MKVYDCVVFKVGYKNLCYIKGVVFYFEFKYKINFGEVYDFEELEELVSKVFEVYCEVCNFFLIYLYFFIGEVEVWFECIIWIMRNMCDNDI